jgi:hypothetical protein
MSIQAPASTPHVIKDFINKVAAILQNRSDITENATQQPNPEMRPSAWIRDSLRELTANYPFPELQKPGPLVTIGPRLGWQGSNYMYQVSKFLAPGEDMTIMEDPVIFLTAVQATSVGLVATTNNQVGYPMDYMTPKSIQTILFTPGGVPFRYTRYGDMFWFGSQPGQNYNVYVPYQVRHPFTDSLPNSPVRIPADWYDVMCFAAAERGAICLRWNDEATFIHNVLYGDPEYQESGGEKGRPGLIAARILQPERDKRLSPVTLQVGYDRY